MDVAAWCFNYDYDYETLILFKSKWCKWEWAAAFEDESPQLLTPISAHIPYHQDHTGRLLKKEEEKRSPSQSSEGGHVNSGETFKI